MKSWISIICILALLLCMPGWAEEQPAKQWETTLQDLAHARIAVVTGTLQAIMLPGMLPEAEYIEFNTVTDAAMALDMGKVDSFSVEDSVYLAMCREGRPFARIDEPFIVSQYGFVFGPQSSQTIHGEFNEFLAAAKADGRLAALQEKWFAAEEPTELLSTKDLTGERGTLKFAAASGMKPYAYIKNGTFTGFDVEVAITFAQEYGYKMEIVDAGFSGMLVGIEQGKYDMGGSGITITEERKKSMTFSDPYFEEDVVMVVRGDQQQSLDDFRDATLGVIDGSIYDGFYRELFPEATLDSYSNFNDLFQCIKQGKIEGFLLDTPNFNAVRRTDDNLSYITVPGYSVEIGVAFAKDENGAKLQAQMNELLDKIRADGTYDAMWEKWCGTTEPTEVPAEPEYAQDAQELNIVLDLSRKPFVYMLDNGYAGFEVELMYLFCETYGYRPVFESAQWTSGVIGLKEGKYDAVSCGIYITEERKESVNFCDPYAVEDVILVTYEMEEDAPSTWESLKESFNKTFVRENRWKMIVEGLINTLIISVLSVLSGSIFGFALYMLVRSKNRGVSAIARSLAKIYGRIIAGMPTLVVLMILFYVCFGQTDIDGLWVAILGFGLTFGAFVYSHLSLSIESLDIGQTEAAYALGYTANQTFFKLLLPQSMKNFLPTYSAEVVGLMKATSVVGYIAVNDLTKMGDIIRSNTYEALFPLLAVALIYFFITWVFAAVLGMLQRKLDNHRRKNKKILKGVVR